MKKRVLALAMILSLLLCGCGNGKDTKVVLTTGFDKNQLFKIETYTCSLSEAMLYLTNLQNRYEEVYGEPIWETKVGDKTMEDNLKETVLAKLAQVKTMNLLADSYGVELDEEEKASVRKAAGEYFSSLNETEKALIQTSEEEVAKMYEEYARADKIYQYLIRDINPEISDDEARTITVEHILIKTYTKDGSGKRIEYSQAMKDDAYALAQEVLAKVNQPDLYLFEDLIKEYSEDSIATYSFGKGEMDPAFEEAAFNLANDEISGIVETELGYHIIKCINTFNRDETDANKLKIVEKRRQEVFGQEYDSFVEGLTRNLNEKLWEETSMIHDEDVKTKTFFDVFESNVTIAD